MAIVAAWKAGVRHRIKLAHVAIKAVEPKAEPYLNPKLYQRRSLTSLGADNDGISRHRVGVEPVSAKQARETSEQPEFLPNFLPTKMS